MEEDDCCVLFFASFSCLNMFTCTLGCDWWDCGGMWKQKCGPVVPNPLSIANRAKKMATTLRAQNGIHEKEALVEDQLLP